MPLKFPISVSASAMTTASCDNPQQSSTPVRVQSAGGLQPVAGEGQIQIFFRNGVSSRRVGVVGGGAFEVGVFRGVS